MRLRLPTGWATLPPGRFEIGRSASCQIVVDGARVSRLHALVVVDDTGATIEDLGSANGTSVNGRRLTATRRTLAEGDVISVGEVGIVVSLEPDVTQDESGAILVRPHSGPAPRPRTSEPPTSAPVSALSLLGSVAERVLAAGDARRAESMLRPALERLLAAARSGEAIDASIADNVLRQALALAAALPAPAWLDFAFEFMTAASWVPSAMQILELERVLRIVPGAGARVLADYVEILRGLPTSMDKLRALPRLERALAELRGIDG